MKALIVDDNDIARTTLAHLAKQVPNLTIVNEYSNAIEAYNHLQNNQVDLIFLDIEMPEMTGIELTKNLAGKDIIIIFTSSNKDYALEAFELNIADYILKPVMPARFLQAVSKAQSILESRKEDVEVTKDEFLFVRDSNITRRLRLDDIFYAEAMGDYVKFYTREKMFAIHGKMKTAEERLPKDHFIRVHRSYIVSVGKIDTLQDGGIMINGKFIPVADAYRRALNTRMNVF
ncbi:MULTISPECIES: LytTR family DNA-binding domain-containing protein [Chryseobacterium]|jgi:two-component system, LytTR family, response regulator|uniref:Sensory transduction protein lytR n=1 Tax=Chryseobacterium indoltheticum TaxID=254 RepID=A0A381F4G3_9FLAO|nr:MULTISPECIES: LytTR family DNA-binding domain-containing protein [Chryseobacterium]AZA74920.1 DNA-binding response regulator [Chryseobacterium indoltheticum]MDF2832089.1 two-component system response regulator [Chryseobacterium indoltheticum]MDQ0782297.1 two-component system LytT family response regulator [Chryseobacterium sp. W4I1]MDQ8141340.1 LytTR family DNA-binding domain-containing protein [Chryseobacterium sp. CFS15]QQQ28321.1 response regulator transcription factor [Chryseobacterium 